MINIKMSDLRGYKKQRLGASWAGWTFWNIVAWLVAEHAGIVGVLLYRPLGITAWYIALAVACGGWCMFQAWALRDTKAQPVGWITGSIVGLVVSGLVVIFFYRPHYYDLGNLQLSLLIMLFQQIGTLILCVYGAVGLLQGLLGIGGIVSSVIWTVISALAGFGSFIADLFVLSKINSIHDIPWFGASVLSAITLGVVYAAMSWFPLKGLLSTR